MIVGLLSLRENQLFFHPRSGYKGGDAVLLEPEAEFEIKLGGVWVPVRFRPEYAATSDEVISWRFVADGGTCCGFVPGMIARLSQLENRKE
jgi:hypothetical protein